MFHTIKAKVPNKFMLSTVMREIVDHFHSAKTQLLLPDTSKELWSCKPDIAIIIVIIVYTAYVYISAIKYL